MKAFLTILITFCGFIALQAQLTNNGATITVESGAVLYVEGDINNTTGTLDMKSGSLVELTGDFVNAATVTAAATSELKFSGDTNSDMTSGGATFEDVTIEKTAADVQLLDAGSINGVLEFNADDNQVLLNGNTLTLSTAATITGADANEFVVTGATGELVKEAMSTFTYPVGFDQTSYNPVTLTESGAVDNKGVTVLENAYEDGTSGGTQITEDVVDATWVVSESTAGGADLTVDAQWAVGDEATGFDRTSSGVALYDMSAYDLLYADLGAATGSDPYNRTRTSFSEVGSFIVGGEPVLDYVTVEPIAFLGGPYSGVSNMNDLLRSKGLLPLGEPYTGLGYTHVALGGSEAVAMASDFDQAGTDDDVVDWVVVELRDKANAATVVSTRSALMQKDGEIVGTDMMPVKFPGFAPDDYFVAIRHRSHLGIRTATATALSHSSTMIDYSDGSTAVHGTDPQQTIGSVDVMWGGNATGDGAVRATGPPTINDYSNLLNYLGGPTGILFNVYSRQDVNMDGNARATGPPTINDYSKLLSILGGPTGIKFEQL